MLRRVNSLKPSVSLALVSLVGVMIPFTGGLWLFNPTANVTGPWLLGGLWATACGLGNVVIATRVFGAAQDRGAAWALAAFPLLLGGLLMLASFGLCGFQTDPFSCRMGD